MTFYMYRAQSEEDYPLESFNGANLAGVLVYLHNEVVFAGSNGFSEKEHCNRKYGITRILRLRISMQTTKDVYGTWPAHPDFMPYVAIDQGACTSAGCNSDWKKFGYAPGCQVATCGPGGLYPYNNSIWFSMPGPCISQDYEKKSRECRARETGGRCARPTGHHSCTWSLEHAGEVSLDELVGIDDRTKFCHSGNKEYDRDTDMGVGVNFWDHRSDPTACAARIEAVQRLFRRKYPDVPTDYPDPVCG